MAVSGKIRKGFKCRVQFSFVADLAAMLLLLSNRNVGNRSVEKCVFMKQLCEAGSRKDQCCGMRSDSTSSQNFRVRLISVLELH